MANPLTKNSFAQDATSLSLTESKQSLCVHVMTAVD
jgi:hypothetical protein